MSELIIIVKEVLYCIYAAHDHNTIQYQLACQTKNIMPVPPSPAPVAAIFFSIFFQKLFFQKLTSHIGGRIELENIYGQNCNFRLFWSNAVLLC